ncbi:uncharacterized protein LOC127045766 [Gopherus flavomarginatus]|uniref:uncharacterized protein LOC127045766 n=1 Tax=Gopherus flavomarginatus TaxID=286002 RepID=UPI0021CBC6D2|nr:uncharacterized protein LOC127045766 [Gopherus flavomarginatus]
MPIAKPVRQTSAQELPPRPAVFYKELDAILGCDPTANPRTTMESSEQGEVGEGVEEAESEGTGVEGDTPESQEACSQELFSSQEEASQSQQLELVGEEEAEERIPMSLNSPALSQPAQRLQNLRNKPRKSKEDLVKAVINQYARESKRLQDWREKMHEWRETQSRRKELATKKTTKQLISLLARQTDCMQSLVAMQADQYRANPHPSQSSLPCSPVFAQNTFLQQPGSYHHQLPPTPVCSPTSPENYDPYPRHSTPITMQHINPEVQQALNSNPGRTYSNL